MNLLRINTDGIVYKVTFAYSSVINTYHFFAWQLQKKLYDLYHFLKPFVLISLYGHLENKLT